MLLRTWKFCWCKNFGDFGAFKGLKRYMCKNGQFRQNVVWKLKIRFRPKITDLTWIKLFGRSPDHKEHDFILFKVFLQPKRYFWENRFWSHKQKFQKNWKKSIFLKSFKNVFRNRIWVGNTFRTSLVPIFDHIWWFWMDKNIFWKFEFSAKIAFFAIFEYFWCQPYPSIILPEWMIWWPRVLKNIRCTPKHPSNTVDNII